jgi:hypothetical protein
MRPAPTAGPPLEDDDTAVAVQTGGTVAPAPPAEPSGVGFAPGPRRKGRSRIASLLVALALVAVAGIAASVMIARRSEPVATPTTRPTLVPTSPPTTLPPRQAFSFTDVQVRSVPVAGRDGSNEAARGAGEAAAGVLSAFYDRAFFDPATWPRGVPDEAWEAFDPAVLERAQRDVASFSLGDAGPDLASLEVTEAELIIQVLLDANGHAQAAFADVVFEADGVVHDGRAVEVRSRATYLLRPTDGAWRIVGYPDASTRIEEAPVPSPSPSPMFTSPPPTSPASGSPSP